MKNLNTEQMKTDAIKRIRGGQPLFGRDGVLSALIGSICEEILNQELEEHLTKEERQKGNKRNGKKKKTIKTKLCETTIETPQDRKNTYRPQFISKHQRMLEKEGIEAQIIGLYASGASTRYIEDHLKEHFSVNVSDSTISKITERLIPRIKEWQNHTLDQMYPIMWLDAMCLKVKEDGVAGKKALYNIMAIDKEGKKKIIGAYVAQSEGAKFWLQVLNDLQNRGLKDVLIVCTDNLKGLSEAVEAVFPKAEIQTCVIHQIRQSGNSVTRKDRREFMADLKPIYQAPTREAGEQALNELEKKWGKKYPLVIKSWRINWGKLSTYFDYSPLIRKLIYSTNPIENFHRQVRSLIKNKGVFPNDMASLKLVYLAVQRFERGRRRALPNWELTVQQLRIRFGDRMPIALNLDPS